MIALYGLEPYHSAPISLDMVQNTLLQEYMGDLYQITTYNEPLPPLCPSIFGRKRTIALLVLIFTLGKLNNTYLF